MPDNNNVSNQAMLANSPLIVSASVTCLVFDGLPAGVMLNLRLKDLGVEATREHPLMLPLAVLTLLVDKTNAVINAPRNHEFALKIGNRGGGQEDLDHAALDLFIDNKPPPKTYDDMVSEQDQIKVGFELCEFEGAYIMVFKTSDMQMKAYKIARAAIYPLIGMLEAAMVQMGRGPASAP
jgi:hypothetical protein